MSLQNSKTIINQGIQVYEKGNKKGKREKKTKKKTHSFIRTTCGFYKGRRKENKFHKRKK